MSDLRGEEKHSGQPATEAALDAISAHLDRDQGHLSGVDHILGRAGQSRHDIVVTFGCVDNLLVALAKHYADQLATPLTRRDITDIAIARDVLIRFGKAAWTEYCATFVGLVRLVTTEGARSKELRDRFYAAGPAHVSRELSAFLASLKEYGVLDFADPALATEQLMGVLREPLYQALLLHPMADSAVDRTESVTAAIDLFLDGCARRSS